MSNELITQDTGAAILEKVVVQGDLSKLSPVERLSYYRQTCQTLGLNPFTRPFDYIVLNGKLQLYARRDATEQLRKINAISIKIISREFAGDLYIVQAKATDKEGRCDESIGAVSITGLKGDALANAMMKAETKAKRRVTLSISGLGWLDESEIETIPSAKIVNSNETSNDVHDGKIIQEYDSSDVISKIQTSHMFAISGGNAELCKSVIEKYGYRNSLEVKQIDYQKICEEIESKVKC